MRKKSVAYFHSFSQIPKDSYLFSVSRNFVSNLLSQVFCCFHSFENSTVLPIIPRNNSARYRTLAWKICQHLKMLPLPSLSVCWEGSVLSHWTERRSVLIGFSFSFQANFKSSFSVIGFQKFIIFIEGICCYCLVLNASRFDEHLWIFRFLFSNWKDDQIFSHHFFK